MTLAACAAPQTTGHPTVDPLHNPVPSSDPTTDHGTTTQHGTTAHHGTTTANGDPITGRTFDDVLVVVSGHAYSSDGVPMQGVEVGFLQQGCADCQPYLGKTDASGTYEITLPPRDYVAACSAGQQDDCVTTSGDDVINLDRATNSVDFVVNTKAPPDPRTTQRNPTNGTEADLSGHVTDPNGKPIPGVIIELHEVGNGRPHIVTDENGYYEINIDVPATVICIAGPESDCSAKGINGQVNVDSDQPPQVIDWVVK